jgi:lysophospholipase L1-like esterase
MISTASCVIYVTISPRAGEVGSQINTAIQRLSKSHSNIHVLDWGQIEYTNPAWVSPDGIHPTPQGESALANLEAQQLQNVCRSQ